MGEMGENESLVSTVVQVEDATLTLSAPPELQSAVDGGIAAFRASGAEPADGVRVDIGWGPFVLKQTGDRRFVVVTPHYAGTADRGSTDDLTLGLWALAAQVQLAELVGVDGVPPSFADRVIIAKRALSAPGWAMTREPPSAGDSGWFVDVFPSLDDASGLGVGDLVAVPASELLHIRKQAVRVLSLPPGVVAVVGEDSVDAVIRESDGTVLFRGDR